MTYIQFHQSMLFTKNSKYGLLSVHNKHLWHPRKHHIIFVACKYSSKRQSHLQASIQSAFAAILYHKYVQGYLSHVKSAITMKVGGVIK